MSNSAALKRYFSEPNNRKKVSDTQKKLHVEHPELFDSFDTVHRMREQGLLPKPSGMTGRNHTDVGKRRISSRMKELWNDSTYGGGTTGKKFSDATREKMSIVAKEHWNNPEYARKVLGRREMSGPELRFATMCQAYGLEYQFVGNGKFRVGRMNPDFVHTSAKRVIEIFGEYFHNGHDPNVKIGKYEDLGYRALVIWASELRHPEQVVAKIQKFEEANYV